MMAAFDAILPAGSTVGPLAQREGREGFPPRAAAWERAAQSCLLFGPFSSRKVSTNLQTIFGSSFFSPPWWYSPRQANPSAWCSTPPLHSLLSKRGRKKTRVADDFGSRFSEGRNWPEPGPTPRAWRLQGKLHFGRRCGTARHGRFCGAFPFFCPLSPSLLSFLSFSRSFRWEERGGSDRHVWPLWPLWARRRGGAAAQVARPTPDWFV